MAATTAAWPARTAVTWAYPPRLPLLARLQSPSRCIHPTSLRYRPTVTTRPRRQHMSTTQSDPTEMGLSPFKYNVAASFIGKGLAFNPATHVYALPSDHSAPSLPANGTARRPASGQDAFFVSPMGGTPGETGYVALGVADGVGGWIESGVDPADFSHGLCNNMARAASAPRRNPPPSARQLIQEGYEAVCGDRSIGAGGSTVVVGIFGGPNDTSSAGSLEVANLGDSGFIHLRLGALHAYSVPQTHAFNTPYQLSVVPVSMLLRAAAFGGQQLVDQPSDADVTRHSLRHGDVVIFASDGLWDNLFNQDVLRIVTRAMTRAGAWTTTTSAGNINQAGVIRVVKDLTPYTHGFGKDISSPLQCQVATDIVAAAKAASMNSKLNGPFAKEVKRHYPQEQWTGGKEDDICVVVCVVAQAAAAAGESEEETSMATVQAKL